MKLQKGSIVYYTHFNEHIADDGTDVKPRISPAIVVELLQNNMIDTTIFFNGGILVKYSVPYNSENKPKMGFWHFPPE